MPCQEKAVLHHYQEGDKLRVFLLRSRQRGLNSDLLWCAQVIQIMDSRTSISLVNLVSLFQYVDL
jgi:hypothetical protein